MTGELSTINYAKDQSEIPYKEKMSPQSSGRNKYDSAEEFVVENPECCRVIYWPYHERDINLDVFFVPEFLGRIFGTQSSVVGIKYIVPKVFGEPNSGVEYKEFYDILSPCGEIYQVL